MDKKEVELDEVEVVDVTGKTYADRNKQNQKKGRCHLTLRDTTLIIFFGLLLLYGL